jgi:hypothetical protein
MYHMAGRAALDFYRLVLVNEGAVLIHVTLETHRILRRAHTNLLGPLGPMWIMAIRALDESFVNAMVERHVELGPLLKVAGIAEFGLRFDQQEFLGLRVVRRVTRDAAHTILRMNRVDGVHMFGAACVAGQATIVDFFGGMILKDEDLRDVPATSNVRRSRAVTAFAPLMRRTASRIQGCLPVRRFLPVVVDIFVAGLADFRSHVTLRLSFRAGR